MALLPPKYLNAVVAIGIESTPEEIESTGQPKHRLHRAPN